jgi:hypothetical protein
MRTMRHSLIALLSAGIVAAGLAPASQAHRAAAATITTIYMSTDPAYAAYDISHPVAPPQVTAFPVNVEFLAVYFVYTGATPKHTTFRVDFTHGSTVARTGQSHTLNGSSGKFIVDLPSEGKLSKGSYQARLYLDNAPAASTTFSLVTTPTVTKGYMITGKAFDNFDTKPGSPGPVKTTSFPANVARVGIYYTYKGATAGDIYFGAVYDRSGKLVHRSHDHPFQYKPNGEIALVLPADSGSYPAGSYRSDIYVNKALVESVPWTAK